jgi:hypothetical protein
MRTLLVIAAALLLGGCSLSFEEARPKAPIVSATAVGLKLDGTPLEQPGSARCNQLDSRQTWFGVTGYSSAAIGAALAGGSAIPPDGKKELRNVVLLTGIGLAGVGVGLLWGQHRTELQWTAEGCAGKASP